MDYISIKAAQEKWGLTERRIQELCKDGKIRGATRFGRAWMIPADAVRPVDRRTKASKAESTPLADKFLIPAPKKNAFLLHTDIYNTPGTAEEIINSFAKWPETQKIFKAQFDCRRGNFESVYCQSEHFLENHIGFYSTISAGISLSFCAIWKGDLSLWQRARAHIYSAPCKNENDRQIVEFWLAVVDSNIGDVRNFPDWFTEGRFDCLHPDSYCTARVFYVKGLYISAYELSHGKIQLENVEKLGLMRTLPYILEPMLSQAKMERTVIPQIYLRLMAATVYHSLGENKKATVHIDRAIELALPDKLYGILTEYRSDLDHLLDDRLALVDISALNRVKALHKQMRSGWVTLHNKLLERNISHTLSVRERAVARLAAFGLSNTEIATRLNIEVSSVKQYIFAAMNKTGAEKRTELGLYI